MVMPDVLVVTTVTIVVCVIYTDPPTVFLSNPKCLSIQKTNQLFWFISHAGVYIKHKFDIDHLFLIPGRQLRNNFPGIRSVSFLI